MEPIRRDAAFQNTRWSMVKRATDPNEQTIAMRALGAFCADYWYPIYAYLRRKGYPQDESEDATQAFFLKLTSEDILAKADPERGKLRNFLLFQLKSLLKSRREKRDAIKRGGGLQKLSLDLSDAEGRYLLEPEDLSLGPDELYARTWGFKTLERCCDQLAAQWASADRASEFEALEPFLSLKQAGDSSASDVAKALGISEENARKKISRIRAEFSSELRKQVAEGLNDPTSEAVDAELDSLRLAVSGSS